MFDSILLSLWYSGMKGRVFFFARDAVSIGIYLTDIWKKLAATICRVPEFVRTSDLAHGALFRQAEYIAVF
jgi:hypothetical protein